MSAPTEIPCACDCDTIRRCETCIGVFIVIVVVLFYWKLIFTKQFTVLWQWEPVTQAEFYTTLYDEPLFSEFGVHSVGKKHYSW